MTHSLCPAARLVQGAQNGPGLTFTIPTSDTAQSRLLRPMALLAAGRAATPNIITTAKSLFTAYAANTSDTSTAIHPDIRQAVYSLAVLSDTAGGASDSAFERVRQLYVASRDGAERERLLGAMSYANTDERIQLLTTFLLSPQASLQVG